MPLVIYRHKEVPGDIDMIDVNDAYFDIYVPLTDSEEVNMVLNRIDKAKVNNSDTFIGRDEELGGIYKNNLSTGTKTALNILNNPDKCFNLIECGNNAVNVILGFKNGHVKWKSYWLYKPDLLKEEIDVVIDGVPIKSVYELSKYIRESR